jgi:hypothetical protein
LVQEYRVRLFLQGNEEEIAQKVMAMLRRVGLNPHIDKDSHKNLINLRTYSKALLQFLPDKEALRDDSAVRERFLDENRLFDVENGVPFLAGFIDGDGNCDLSITKRRFKSAPMEWRLSQTSLRFMVDYIVRFVGSPSPDSVSVTEVLRKDGRRESNVRFLKPAINALLRAGIAKYSFKVAGCVREMTAFQSEFRNYYTVGVAAHVLGVKPWVVRRMADAGEIKCNRTGGSAGSPDLSHRYIPIEEVKKLLKKLEVRRSKNEAVKRGGVKLTILAGLLGVSKQTLEWLYLNRKLCATLLVEDHGRGSSYLVIPYDEVKKLKKRYAERKKREAN